MPRDAPPASETDPCWKERQLTYKCFADNDYDKDKCEGFIKNGKYCKLFWHTIMKERRVNGIYPELPPANERDEIKAERMKTYKKPNIHIFRRD